MAHGRRELAAFPIQASEASQTRWSRGLAVAPKDEHGSPTRRKRNVMEWSGGAAGQWRSLLRLRRTIATSTLAGYESPASRPLRGGLTRARSARTKEH